MRFGQEILHDLLEKFELYLPIMETRTILKNLPFTVALIAFATVLPYPKSPGNILTLFSNTTVWWLVYTAILYMYFVAATQIVTVKNARLLLFVKLYLIFNVLQIIRGLFVADGYWEWKGLVNNTMILLMPVISFSTTNTRFVQVLFQKYIRYTLPFLPLVLLFASTGAVGFFLALVPVLLIFIFNMPTKWKLVTISLVVLIFVIDLDARSNVIKFLVPCMFLILIYLRHFFSQRFFEQCRLFLFVLPIIFFALAVSGIFNIFKMEEYVGSDKHFEKKTNTKGEIVEIDLTADTRTGLYEEVLSTAEKYNTWWLGRSPARGNETELFSKLEEITGKSERLSNEFAIANVFTWTGIIGVVLYGLAFYRASFLSVNCSRNIYSKCLGLYLAFRWAFGWVEDINHFTLTHFTIWVMIGLCTSRSFREMTDKEVRLWVKGIFDYKYYRVVRRVNNKLNRSSLTTISR